MPPWADVEHPADRLIEVTLDRHAERVNEHPVLEDRLRAHVPDFWRAFAAVYGDSLDAAAWAVHALDAALDAAADRPGRLRDLDRRRAGTSGWFQHQRMFGLMAYTDHFAGTLTDVRAKIPYLKELGITYVHLMPLLQSREGRNDGGYAVQDYRAVNPDLGTMDDLRALADALHDADMILVVDLVMNHTAQEHAWAQAARDGDPRYRDFYYTFADRMMPDRYERTLPEVFPDFAPGNFTYVDALERWVWTTFYDFQWDLNYRNPDVFVHMLREMLFLANTGIDALRLDAVPYLWKEMGTNCQNRPEAHRLLQAYRALMRIAAPGVLFKAEAIVAPDDIIPYFGTGDYAGKECEIAYNAALMSHLWHALASENTQLLQTMLRNLPEAPNEAAWINYVRAHDDIGWGISDRDAAEVHQNGRATRRFCADFYAGKWDGSTAQGYDFQRDPGTGEARTSGTTAALAGLQNALIEGTKADIDRAVERVLLLHSVTFVMRGIPLLYSGDEVGQLNDFSYLLDPLRARDNRWIHRPQMDWDKAALRHEPGRVEARLFDGLKRFAAVRKQLPALHGRAAERVLTTGNDRCFVVERTRGIHRLLAVFNFSGQAQAVPLASLPGNWPTPAFTDVLAEETLFFPDGRLIVPPYGFWWLAPAPDEAAPGPPVPTAIALDVETNWGEQVYLTGRAEALGAGDPHHAHGPCSAETYPTWTTTLELPAGAFIEMRWLKRRAGQLVERSNTVYGVRAGTNAVWPIA